MTMTSKFLNTSESGNAWWFHSELTYSKTLIDLPPLPTKNLIQWIPFGTHDVAQLEKCFTKYKEIDKDKDSDDLKAKVSETDNKKDELEIGERFVKVKADTRQYLKVDLERMRMGPIYWEGEEYFIRRATWFLVPEGAKISEGFPVERGLESLLTNRYNETIQWLNYYNNRKSSESNSTNNNFDDTIVEKIVSLVPEEGKEEYSGFRDLYGDSSVKHNTNSNTGTNKRLSTKPAIQIPRIQTHDPQAPDISRYFLVFRQGCTDYARLCVEKKQKGQKEKDKDKESSAKETINNSNSTKHSRAASISSNSKYVRSSSPHCNKESLLIPDIPAVLPLESMNPISASSAVLSTSFNDSDLHEEVKQNENLYVEDNHDRNIYNESTNFSKYVISDSPRIKNNNASSTNNNLTTGGYHSFRLYRTYASFYHANGSEGGSARVQTQRQTIKIDGVGEALKDSSNSTSNNGSNKKSVNSQGTNSINSNTNNPGLDAAIAWKSVRVQNHSFKGHPLPSPEIPCDLSDLPGAKYVVFLVHGVGQRAFRKMGFHFNKDCDEMRNVLLDAAQVRGLSPGNVVVLPISWRAELNLAGNFTFGDEFDNRTDFELFNEDSNLCGNTPMTADSCEVSTLNQKDGNTEKMDRNENTPVISANEHEHEHEFDKDLQNLSENLKTKLDTTASSFQRAVSVFEGQFTEILERLALESIPAVRSVLSDATMDILLYVSPKHFKRILGSVLKEVLRMHRLFVHWNPEYRGEFSFAAHSLGSVLVADLLSYTAQPDNFIAKVLEARKSKSVDNGIEIDDISLFKELAEGNGLPFKVDKFFAMGSPLGVFNLLKHTKPVGCVYSPHINTALQERQRKWQLARKRPGGEEVSDVPAWTVYNCRLFYNVFHPHDPVAHRFESLTMPRRSIDPTCSGSGAALQPPLKIPYHKSGLTRFKMDLEAKLARAKDDWSRGIQNMTMKWPTWLGGKSGSSKKLEDKDTNQDQDNISTKSEFFKTLRDDNPLAAFNHHFRRIDFSLQHSVMENPYISALGAHFVYWSDLDIASFIISELIKN